MALEWDDEYSVNDEYIDQQHIKLFEMVNNFEQMFLQGNVTDEIVDEALRYLTNYTRIHFVYEEFCMKKYKCPIAEKNMDAHDKFMQKIQTFQARFENEGASQDLVEQIYNAASQWLVKHICKIDVELRASIEQGMAA